MINIYNFENCEYSDRHGSYAGMAGDKDGIMMGNSYWIIKYPKTERAFKTPLGMSYTTSPLSEFVGSHIYDMLGIPVHETALGVRNNKVVVACKAFCITRGSPMEMRISKNAANKELSKTLDEQMHYSGTGDRVNLKELLLHLQYNPIVKKCPDAISRFWNMVVVDILIDNTDRNNGNWGLLYNEKNKTYNVAPVYDNGNSFSNKSSDKRINKIIHDKNKSDLYIGSRTAYEVDGHILSAKKMIQYDDLELKEAIKRLSPIIKEKLPDIRQFISAIPEKAGDWEICSKERKQYIMESVETRFDKMIYPEYLKNIELENKIIPQDDDIEL